MKSFAALVRRSRAPLLAGMVREHLRPAGEDLRGLRLRVPPLEPGF